MKPFLTFTTLILITMLANTNAEETLDKVIAHRGASYDAPENTHAAIALAIEKKAGVIEFDVMVTTDGKLYLFHDKELKRLCGRKGTFDKLRSAEVAKLDVGTWFKKGDFKDETPPTFQAAIKQCLDGNAIPLIEHKTGSAKAYADVLIEMDVVEKVIVQSFNWEFLTAIKAILPNLKIGALSKGKVSSKHEALLTLKPNWVGWSTRDIGVADIKWLKENNFKIAVWTVNDPTRANYLITNGVDKIITDRPAYISEKL